MNDNKDIFSSDGMFAEDLENPPEVKLPDAEPETLQDALAAFKATVDGLADVQKELRDNPDDFTQHAKDQITVAKEIMSAGVQKVIENVEERAKLKTEWDKLQRKEMEVRRGQKESKETDPFEGLGGKASLKDILGEAEEEDDQETTE